MCMPRKGRAGGRATPAGKRGTRVGVSTPNSASPAVEEEYEILAEDLEAGSEAIQAVQSSNASSEVKERVAALGSKFLAQKEQIEALQHDHYYFEPFPFSNWFATVLDWLKQS